MNKMILYIKKPAVFITIVLCIILAIILILDSNQNYRDYLEYTADFLIVFIIGINGVFGKNYNITKNQKILKLTIIVFFYGSLVLLLGFFIALRFLNIIKHLPNVLSISIALILSSLINLKDLKD